MSTVIGQKKKHPRIDRRKNQRTITLARYPVAVYGKTNDAGAKDQESTEAVGVGIVTDISPFGVGLILGNPLKAGDRYYIVLNAGTDKERELEARALWSTTLPSTGHIIKPDSSPAEFWRVGMSFDTKDEEQNDFLEALVRSLKR